MSAMPHPAGASLIARFLGEDSARGGPFALLGLRPGVADDSAVIAALERRLVALAAHHQSETPEADEVRLALHAAAAQLLDPAVRVHLARRWGGEAAAQQAALAAPTSEAGRGVLLEHDALLTLARYGGWNRGSLHRLMLLARARDASPDEIVGALRRLSSRGAASARAVPRPAPVPALRADSPPVPVRLAGLPKPLADEPPRPADPRPPEMVRPEEDDPAKRLLRRGVFVLIGGFVALAVLGSLAAILLTVPRTPPDPPPPPPPARASAEPARVEPFPLRPSVTSDARPRPTGAPSASELNAALRGLDAAVDGLALDPGEALALFRSSALDVAAHWCLLAPDRQRAATNSVVEFMHSASAVPLIASAAAEVVAAGSVAMHGGAAPDADGVWPAVWSAGTLVRLSGESGLSAVVSRVIEDALRQAIGGAGPAAGRTFDAGAVAALGLLPRRFVLGDRPDRDTELERWRRWVRAVDAAAPEQQARRIELLLAGLDAITLAGPEPDVDPAIADAMVELTLALTWRRGDRSRTWLVQAFGNPRVSNADLHVITTALATRSNAEGVDPLMSLPARSIDAQRRDLRNRYETAWGLPTAAQRDDLADSWLQQLRRVERDAHDDRTPTDHLARAVLAARLNAAASLRWSGGLDAAALLIDRLDAPVKDAMETVRGSVGDQAVVAPGRYDGAWAVRYASAQRDADARVALLRELGGGSILDPISGEVLAQEAVRGSPAQVRQAARDALLALRMNASALKGLLEQAPTMPRTIQNAELVAQMTGTSVVSVRDPDWKLKTRRVLVERLMELLAAEGEVGRVDRLAPLLAETYAGMASSSLAPSSADGTPAAADESAARLRAQWQQLAADLSAGRSGVVRAEEIERRRTARLAVAGGPVQRFAVEQLAVAELLSAVIAVERPERAADAAGVLSELAGTRRTATHVLHQIAATELAIARLWAIRFGEELP